MHLASNGRALRLLQTEFPHLPVHEIPGLNIAYSRRAWMVPLALALRIPSILLASLREKEALRKLHSRYKFSLVISDNRFGCAIAGVKSCYVTHQVLIPFPSWLRRAEFLGVFLHGLVQKQFNQVWIPDWPQAPGLSGRLGHGNFINHRHRYIGPLSRFKIRSTDHEKDIDLLLLLSGPEPQRTLLEEKLLGELEKFSGKVILLRGTPAESLPLPGPAGIEIFPHASGRDMSIFLERSKVVVARSGYTTVMELANLQSKAILIPTPGQAEQEYLGEMLENRGWCACISQENVTLSNILEKCKQLGGFPPAGANEELLDKVIAEVLDR